MRRVGWAGLALAGLGLWLWQARTPAPRAPAPPPAVSAPAADAPVAHGPTVQARASLPPEADATLRRIAAGGPFPHPQDGGVFGNRERHLPPRPRGWYHEYTVATPGSPDRGARRIVTGGTPPREYWYSDDHYRSFRRFEPEPAR